MDPINDTRRHFGGPGRVVPEVVIDFGAVRRAALHAGASREAGPPAPPAARLAGADLAAVTAIGVELVRRHQAAARAEAWGLAAIIAGGGLVLAGLSLAMLAWGAA